VKARAELTVDDAVRWRSDPPVVLRPTGGQRVHVVQAAGGPLGGDDLGLAVRVGSGARLELRTAAATVVQPGSPPGPARWTLDVELAGGAHLDWRPEPTVVCDGAELRSTVRIRLSGRAGTVFREEIVLGRAGQRGGRYHGELAVEYEDVPLLVHSLLLDGADPALSGPAGTGGCRAVGMMLVVGADLPGPAEGAGEQPGLRWACSALDGPGRLLLAVGDAPAVAAVLDHAAEPMLPQQPGRCPRATSGSERVGGRSEG